MAEALLHSTTVYLYKYDAEGGSYAQQTDSALGCAFLGATTDDGAAQATTFKLLLYTAQKQPVLQMPVTSGARFLPQKDNYVNFYSPDQQNYSMRFRDASECEAFLTAAAFIKAHVVVHTSKYFKASRGDKLTVVADDLAAGKSDAPAIAHGDVAGIALQRWQGSVESRSGFFSPNPLEISHQPAVETVSGNGSDVKRIRLMEYEASNEEDRLVRALAAEALIGMQKTGKRLVTVVSPSTQEWFIAQVELVKVKKATRASAVAADSVESSAVDEETKGEEQAEGHAHLVQRMASLSRAGSQSTGLIASLSSKIAGRRDSMERSDAGSAVENPSSTADGANASASSQSAPPAGYVPVLLAGLQLPGQRADSFSHASSTTAYGQDSSEQSSSSSSLAPQSPSSLAGKVIAPLKNSPRGSADSGLGYVSEMEQLMKEQSDLEKLRQELEESKKKLQLDDSSSSDIPAPVATSGSSSSSFALASVSGQTASNGYKPWEKPGSIPTPFELSSFSRAPTSVPASMASTTAANASGRWTPGNFDLVPSFSPSSFMPPNSIPPAPPLPSSYSSALAPFGGRSIGSTSTFASGDVENGISRLQRSSTSIESHLQDLQSKMDRLLNLQNSFKTSKYSAGAGLFNGSSSLSSSSSSVSAATSTLSSSASLLKNLEKALNQRDQLQEANARLHETVSQLESSVEDLQNQHESLQLENRNLLDKLQNGNQLQHEKFRMELRNLQQQLSHTQEQMLVYQEENFHLRNDLAIKDEQLVKEKAKLQDDARKQLEQLQRQLQDQVQQDSKDALGKVTAEKKALESQVADFAAQKRDWENERESMRSQLRQAQTQQLQFQNEKAQSQAAQDSRVYELEAQLQQALGDLKHAKAQTEQYAADSQHLEELLVTKEHEMEQLQTVKSEQEYAALSELLKEFMNDIYFHFQDAFDEDTEFTGKEIVMAIRKILKQNTMDILSKLEEFWQVQTGSRGRN